MAEKTRYSDEELEEFRQIINEKMALAKRDYDQMMRVLMNEDSNDVDDTSPTYKALEEGSVTQSKEELISMAARQQKFIQVIVGNVVVVGFHEINHLNEIVILEADGSLSTRTVDGMLGKILHQALNGNFPLLPGAIAPFLNLHAPKHSAHSTFTQRLQVGVKFIVDVRLAVSVL